MQYSKKYSLLKSAVQYSPEYSSSRASMPLHSTLHPTPLNPPGHHPLAPPLHSGPDAGGLAGWLGWVGLGWVVFVSPLLLALSIPAFRLHSAYWVACTLEPACSMPSHLLFLQTPSPSTLHPAAKDQSCWLLVSPAAFVTVVCERARGPASACRDPTSAVWPSASASARACRLLVLASPGVLLHHFHPFLPS